MKAYAIAMLEEMERELEDVHILQEGPLSYSEHAIAIVKEKIQRLRNHFMENTFAQKKDEIEFFKLLKPKFTSQLIYYNEVFNIETNKPSINGKPLRRYYRMELEKIERFFDENIEFYKYCRTSCSHLDKKYFMRKHNIRLTLDSSCFQSDPDFSTSHDFKTARLLASESIRIYLQQELLKMADPDTEPTLPPRGLRKMDWTAPKTALTELVYALHAFGVFNNGDTDIREMVTYFEVIFNVSLENYYQIYKEIRARKGEKTKFLDALSEGLSKSMDEADCVQ